MSENLADKKMFTPSNMVFIVGLAVHLVVSYFILDAKIEKYASIREKDKEIFALELAMVKKDVTEVKEKIEIHDLALQTFAQIQGNMIREERPKIKKYK